MEVLGAKEMQCLQANKEFGRDDCCKNPKEPHPCISGGWPEFERYGFDENHTSSAALTWEDLKFQIGCRRVPVAFTWAWVGEGGHMMVAYGYRMEGSSRRVLVLDPLPVGTGSPTEMAYENYVQGTDHTHWDDYYDVRKKN